MSRSGPTLEALSVAGLCLLLVVGATAAFGGAPGAGSSIATAQEDDGQDGSDADDPEVSEERYVEEAPEEGDEYFEAQAPDGSWISYVNPRDRYRDPMVGNASGKVCLTLRNEAGEVVVGESVPNTTVTIPTPTLPWHSHADPMVVEFPLTDNYDRPLDADQFGTTPDLPQGDGYMDSHCIEYHGPRDNETIEYGEPVVDGEGADDVEVVGYVQQAHEAWDTDVDAMEDAVSYEEAGGEWTMAEGKSHGQVVVVLQLDGAEREATTGGQKDAQTNGTGTATESAETATPTGTVETGTDENATAGETADESSGPLDQTGPGFGAVALALVVSAALLARRRR